VLPLLLPDEGEETAEVPVVGLEVGVSILYLGLADSETKSMDLI